MYGGRGRGRGRGAPGFSGFSGLAGANLPSGLKPPPAYPEREIAAPTPVTEFEVDMLEKYREMHDLFRRSPYYVDASASMQNGQKSLWELTQLSKDYFPREFVNNTFGRPQKGRKDKKKKKNLVLIEEEEEGEDGEEKPKAEGEDGADKELDEDAGQQEEEDDLDAELAGHFDDDDEYDEDSLSEGGEDEATF